MRKYSFSHNLGHNNLRKLSTCSSRLEATLNYHLYVNSGLNNLLMCQNYIKSPENVFEFTILRDNYCLRSVNMATNLAEMLKQALVLGDYATATILSTNLHEETGEGRCNHAHPQLMLNLFNILSEAFFEIGLINYTDLHSSKNISRSTEVFIEDMKSLFSSNISYHTKIGALLALESTAPSMLKVLHKILLPLIITLKDQQQKECLQYFDCHRYGVEEKHGNEVLNIASSICKTEYDFKMIGDGANLYHSRQSQMWIELLKIIELNNNSSVIRRFDKT